MSNILVYLDQFKGAALPASWEALTPAHALTAKLGGNVIALSVGADSKTVAEQAFQFDVSAAYYSDDASLADYRAEPYAALVSKVARDQGASVLLFPTTTRGRELAAMVAVDLATGVMPDVTSVDVEGGKVVVTRPVYAGKLIAKTNCSAQPLVVTLRGRAYKKPQGDASKKGAPVRVDAVMSEGEIRSKVTGYTQAEGGVSGAGFSPCPQAVI